ncbi:MAG: fibronectin type III domain-containing protein [Clostridia bacterium]|nr:fibronectin type III domain-containing protein [Clostridia bacterium]
MKKVLTAIVTFIFSVCLITASLATATAASVKKVSNFKGAAKPTEVTLTWSKTSGAKGYEVQQKSGKKWKTVATIKKQKTTSYTVKKLKNGTTYQFRIRAVNGKKKGSYVTAKVKTGVQKITGVKATSASLTSVKLTWDKANVTGYEIQRKDGKKWKTVTKIKKAKTTSYTVKKLPAGKSASFRIRGYVSGSAKTYYGSYTKEIKCKTAVPAVSKASVKSVTPTSVTLSWSKVSSVNGYEIQRKDGKSWKAVTTIKKQKTTSYTVKSLSALTNYTFRVRAYQKSGKTTYYSAWKEVKAKTAIGTASNVKYASLTPTSVKLTWTAAPGAAGYTVNYNGTKVNVKTNSATLTLKAGTAYKVTVTPYNGSTVGKATSAVSFTTPCAKVTGLKASAVAETSLTFTWAKATGAASYQLQYAKAGSGWSSAVSVSGTSYQIKDLSANTSYSVRVRAVNKNGSTTQYGEFSATAVSATKGVVAGTNNTLNWAKVAGAESYTVQYFDTETAAWKTVAAGLTANSYTADELSADTAKLYRVVAYAGGKVIYTSNAASVNLAEVKFSVSNNILSASWSKYAGAASYEVRIKSRGMADSGAKVLKATASGRSVKSSVLAPGLIYDVTVVSVNGAKETALASFAVKSTAFNYQDNSDKGKTNQLLYLIEAVNRSKHDKSYSVVLKSTPYNVTNIKYVDFGFQIDKPASNANLLEKGAYLAKVEAVEVLLRMLFDTKYDGCKLEDGFVKCTTPEAIDGVFGTKDENGNLIEKMSKQESGGFTSRYTFFDGKFSGSADLTLEGLIQPFDTADGLAYLYNANNASAWKNGFSSVVTTKTENGYKIEATLKQETAPNYHNGLVSSASLSSVGDIGLGDAGEAVLNGTVGATTIVAEIDNDCMLTSYYLNSPYQYDMSVEVSLSTDSMNLAGEDEDATSDALKNVLKLLDKIVIEMNTKVEGRQEYTYTFNRSK